MRAENTRTRRPHPSETAHVCERGDWRNALDADRAFSGVLNRTVSICLCRQYLYYTLTDKGIEYLREYLHVSEDTVPATLKKSSKPQPPPSFGAQRQEGEGGERGRGGFRGGRGGAGGRGGYRGPRDGADAGAESTGASRGGFASRGGRGGGRGGASAGEQ